MEPRDVHTTYVRELKKVRDERTKTESKTKSKKVNKEENKKENMLQKHRRDMKADEQRKFDLATW